MEEKRKRGAPLGNQNAVKHGFYCRELNKEERFDFDIAAGMEGITEEIALLRFEIKKAISGGDIYNLIPLSKAAFALEKLIRTHHKLYAGDGWRNGLKNVMRDLIIPFGGQEMAFQAIKNWCGYDVIEANKANQKSINGKNEADLTYNKNQKTEAV